MDLNEYQKAALHTKQVQKNVGDGLIVSLLGLACEASGPLAEFKKHIRDGEAHKLYKDRMREEFGDVLWYLSSAADEFGLSLQDIATENLRKTRDRWDRMNLKTQVESFYDDGFPEAERIPRHFVIRFLSFEDDGRKSVHAYLGSRRMGEPLTDNAHSNDGYRFHDMFHLSCASVLGWSPVVRRNLGLKRRSNLKTDEVEDGGRATVIEEAISALVFDYARSHDMLSSVSAVDYELLRTIKTLAERFEVKTRTTADWERAIMQGYSAWRQLQVTGEGYAICDLENRTISFTRDPGVIQGYANPENVSLGSDSPVEV